MKNIIMIQRIILSMVFFANGYLKAQVPKPPVNIPSPTAFSFQQYGNFNGTSFTGAVPVSIPIYNLEYKSLNLPLALNHISTGVKTDQVPGWVGVNMNLNIGGVITRQVRGLCDEFKFELAPGSGYVNGGIYNNGYLFNNPASTFFYDEIRKTSQPFMLSYNGASQPVMQRIPQRPLPYKGFNWQHEREIYWAGNESYAGLSPMSSVWHQTGIKDFLPDEFNFNFLDFSGSFYFKGENAIVVHSQKQVKIERFTEYLNVPFVPFPATNNNTSGIDVEYNGWSSWVHAGKYPKTISGFKISDNKGYVYYFGKNAEMVENPAITNPTNEYFNSVAIEYSISHQSRSTDYWKADAWYLVRILCPDGRKIDFNYERGNLVNASFNSGFTRLSPTSNAFVGIPSLSSDQDLKSPVYLKTIQSDMLNATFYRETTPELKVTSYGQQAFIAGNAYQKLSGIEIKPRNKPILYYRLGYEYDTCNRWFLKSFSQYAPGSTDSAIYRFEYSNISKLPPLQSYKTDHWGYFNNTNSLSADPAQFYTLKQANPLVNQYGALKKITYPTGGFTEFEYEPNLVAKVVNDQSYTGVYETTNTIIGGLRIRKIFNGDGIVNRKLVKEYFYTNNYDRLQADNAIYNPVASGILSFNPKYAWAATILNADKLTAYSYAVIHSLAQNIPLQVYTSSPINALLEDNHVSYSQVVERNPDKSYSIFKYTDAVSNPDLPPVAGYNNFLQSPYYKASSKNAERGQLKQYALYDSSGKLVKEVQTAFGADYLNADGSLPADTLYDAQALEAKEEVGSILGDHYFFVSGTAYKKFRYDYVPKDNTETLYDKNSNALSSVSKSYYDNPLHRQVTRSITTTSTGDTLKTYIKYVQDYDNNNFLVQRMVNKGFTAIPIETLKTIVKAGTTEELLLSAEFSQYVLHPNNSQDFLLSSTWLLNPAAPFPLNSLTATSPGNNISWGGSWLKDIRYQLQMSFDKYDTNKNPAEFIEKGNLKSAVLYGRNNMEAVMSAINCPDARRLGYTSFESVNLDRNWTLESLLQYDSVTVKTGYKSAIGTFIFTAPAGTNFGGLYNVSVELWSKAGGAVPSLQYQMYNATSNWVNFSQSPDLLKTENGWNLYRFKHTYTIPTYAIKISSNGNNIDEVRIYPSDYPKIMVQTICYSEAGLLVATTDFNNTPTFYEYDLFGRLKYVKDADKNIIKVMGYKYNAGVGE
jgi:YD repeat-containing protein